MLLCTYRGQRTTLWSCMSLIFMRVLWIELKSLGLHNLIVTASIHHAIKK